MSPLLKTSQAINNTPELIQSSLEYEPSNYVYGREDRLLTGIPYDERESESSFLPTFELEGDDEELIEFSESDLDFLEEGSEESEEIMHVLSGRGVSDESNIFCYNRPKTPFQFLDKNDSPRGLPLVDREDRPVSRKRLVSPIAPKSRSAVKRKVTHSNERRVSFAALQIREYNQVLGDHPCCSSGPPISLGWDHVNTRRVDINEYERTRSPRRTRRQLKMRSDERRNILVSLNDSFTNAELRKMDRRLNEENMQCFFNDFFMPVESEQEEEWL